MVDMALFGGDLGEHLLIRYLSTGGFYKIRYYVLCQLHTI